MAAIVLEKPCFIPHLKITDAIDSTRLEAAFRSGLESRSIEFELNWIEKLLACFKGNQKSEAARLMYDFGKAIRNFDLPDNAEVHREKFKLDAFKFAGQLRLLVNNDTLENFDALINQKLKHMMNQRAGPSAKPAPVKSQAVGHDNTDVVDGTHAVGSGSNELNQSYSYDRTSLSQEDAENLFGAFYAEPVLAGKPADSIPSVRSEFVSLSSSCDSGTSVQFMDPYGARLLEKRRMDEILNVSKPALPISTIAVSPSKPESDALPDSTAVPDLAVSRERRHSSSAGIEERAKYLLHAVAEQLDGFVGDLGKKFDKLSEQANGVFGGHVSNEDHAQSIASVEVAIAVIAADDGPIGIIEPQSIAGQIAVPVDQPKELATSPDQIGEPEHDESEVNPFELAEKDQIEVNQRYEEYVRGVQEQIAKPRDEESGTAPAEPVESTGPAQYEQSGPRLKPNAKRRAKEVAKDVAEKAGAAWDKTAELRGDVAEIGKEAFSIGVEAGKAAAGWMAAHLGMKQK